MIFKKTKLIILKCICMRQNRANVFGLKQSIQKLKRKSNKMTAASSYGPPIFLTGYGCPTYFYSNFAEQGFTIIAVWDEYPDLDSFVKDMKRRKPSICAGHSMGVAFAVYLATYEMYIPKLVLFDGHMGNNIGCPLDNYESIFGGKENEVLKSVKDTMDIITTQNSVELLNWCNIYQKICAKLYNDDLQGKIKPRKNIVALLFPSTKPVLYTFLSSLEDADNWVTKILPKYFDTIITANLWNVKDGSDGSDTDYLNKFNIPDHFDCIEPSLRDYDGYTGVPSKPPFIVQIGNC